MEKHMESFMEELMNHPQVYSCLFADHQGLSLGMKGTASTESAGIIAAMAEEAAKLEPKSKPPIIHLENDDRSCIIQRLGTITGAVFRKAPPQS